MTPIPWQQQINKHTVVRPSLIANAVNGELTPQELAPIYDGKGKQCGQMEPTAAKAYNAMTAAAMKDGVYITSISSYRDLAAQVKLLHDRYDHTNHGLGHVSYAGQDWYLKPGEATVATPGHSHHSDGLADDVNHQGKGVVAWLEANAARFGFEWELVSEEWHLHYWPGDAIPQAVLDNKSTVPTTSEEDDDMPYIAQLKDTFTYQGESIPAGYAVEVIGQVRHHISGPQYDSRVANGRKVIPMDSNEMTDLFDATVTDIHRLLKA